MIGKILVALDASNRAPGVLAAAAEVAAKFGATLVPFRAISIPQDFPASAHTSKVDQLPSYLVAEATSALEALVRTVPAALSVSEPIVRVGQPWRFILLVADELNVDLIVLGSHGYHALDRILGTTAGKVANLARRNVLVVHNRVEPPSSASMLPGGT
jgi:nucleotide-binding universal stress UspA family protein